MAKRDKKERKRRKKTTKQNKTKQKTHLQFATRRTHWPIALFNGLNLFLQLLCQWHCALRGERRKKKGEKVINNSYNSVNIFF